MKNMKNKFSKNIGMFLETIKSWQTDHEEYRDLVIEKIYEEDDHGICAEAHDEDNEYVLYEVEGNIKIYYVSDR